MQALCPFNVLCDSSKNSICLAYLKAFALDPAMKKVGNFIFMWWVIIFMLKVKGWGESEFWLHWRRKIQTADLLCQVKNVYFNQNFITKEICVTRPSLFLQDFMPRLLPNPILHHEWAVAAGPKMTHGAKSSVCVTPKEACVQGKERGCQQPH